MHPDRTPQNIRWHLYVPGFQMNRESWVILNIIRYFNCLLHLFDIENAVKITRYSSYSSKSLMLLGAFQKVRHRPRGEGGQAKQ